MTSRRTDGLSAALDALRPALDCYLSWLREAWKGGRDGDEITRLLRAAGRSPEPTAAQRAGFASAIHMMDADHTSPFGRIASVLGLDTGEQLLVAGAWWAGENQHVATLLGCAHDDGNRRFLSVTLLRALIAPFGIDAIAVVEPESALVRCGVVIPIVPPDERLDLTPTARQMLAGDRLVKLVAEMRVPARALDDRDRLVRLLASGLRTAVAVRGPRGVGRHALAIDAVLTAGCVAISGARPANELRLLTACTNAVPVVDADSAPALDWRAGDGPLVVVADLDASPEVALAGIVELRYPDTRERSARWHERLAETASTGDTTEAAAMLAARFRFTETEIDVSFVRASSDAAVLGVELDTELLWAAARAQPRDSLDRMAALVTPEFSLDDLVLQADAAAQLHELVHHVALQHVVLDEWGFRRMLPRGQGVAALFAGPPGTGKTMAAEAIASELGQDLWRVDLSCVVSKYIGETEKNLAVAFDDAERAGAVLFFDEADALFAKRTDVRDAHDRYANIEVNYLLQRVESFTGLVVLASNRQSSLDEAFLRRLRFVIRFEPPDPDLRRKLWQRAFPAETKVDDLNWGMLMSADVTGGNIQNVALNAAYLAASDGGIVTADHVQLSLQREYEKLGKVWMGPTIARATR